MRAESSFKYPLLLQLQVEQYYITTPIFFGACGGLPRNFDTQVPPKQNLSNTVQQLYSIINTVNHSIKFYKLYLQKVEEHGLPKLSAYIFFSSISKKQFRDEITTPPHFKEFSAAKPRKKNFDLFWYFLGGKRKISSKKFGTK